MYKGGCLCGAVRYEAAAPAHNSTLCHCPTCRRASAAPCVAWFSVARTQFRYTAGVPAAFHSSHGVTREFCAQCGTPLTYANVRAAGELDVTTASLDHPEAIPPQDHTFSEHRLRWLHLGDDLPRYLRTRGDGALESA